MLAVLQLDAVNRGLCARLAAEGRMPAYAELLRRGRLHDLDTPATFLPSSTYHTLYSGIPLGEHPQHYSIQWAPGEQRLRYRRSFPVPQAVWERIVRAGRSVFILDPYESVKANNGSVVSGWQLENVLSLDRWSTPDGLLRSLERRHGRSALLQDVFGRPTVPRLLRARELTLGAPRRIAAAVEDALAAGPPDLLWATFLCTHFAGHMLWNLSQLDEQPTGDDLTRLTEGLADVYEETDRALARILDALPGDADVLLLSALGMDENDARPDLLPDMLAAVLAGGPLPDASGAGGFVWRLRARVPTSARAAVARVLQGRLTREVFARLSTAGVDWSTTPAFVLPSDQQGQIRLNVRGRERDGIVEPGEVPELVARITEGLTTFRDEGGGPAVRDVAPIEDFIEPDAPYRASLPDLVVRWSETPATRLRAVVSETYGRVARQGGGIGRSGGHTADAWAAHVPAGATGGGEAGRGAIVDIAPTVCAALGVDAGDLSGSAL